MLRGILQEQRLQRRYREHFQVVHYSRQSNHLHLIVEAADPRSMRVGVSALVIAFAKRLDKLFERLTGKVWSDRDHSRELETPSEVRRALVYVLQNVRKRGFELLGPFIDPLTTAKSFAGWTVPIGPDADPFPSRAPRTWLLREAAGALRTARSRSGMRPSSSPRASGAGCASPSFQRSTRSPARRPPP